MTARLRFVIEFELDPRPGLATYSQLVLQLRQALRLGSPVPGDQLPTAREVVERLAINPNTGSSEEVA